MAALPSSRKYRDQNRWPSTLWATCTSQTAAATASGRWTRRATSAPSRERTSAGSAGMAVRLSRRKSTARTQWPSTLWATCTSLIDSTAAFARWIRMGSSKRLRVPGGVGSAGDGGPEREAELRRRVRRRSLVRDQWANRQPGTLRQGVQQDGSAVCPDVIADSVRVPGDTGQESVCSGTGPARRTQYHMDDGSGPGTPSRLPSSRYDP